MDKILKFINKNKYIILLIILYLLFFIQMQQIFFYGDDYEVLYPLNNNHSFINILNFCIKKMSYFWNEWSGRIVGHFTVSFGLSFFGIQFFRILNPIMLFLLVYFVLKILSLFKKFNFIKYLFFISLIIFGLNINITRESIYWSYSGILYIWGFNLTLIVIYFIYKYYLLNKTLSKLIFLVLTILCVLQTFILEQLSFLIISFLFIMSIIDKKNNKYLLILLLISIFCFCISTFAPGNVLRTEPLIDELASFSTFQIVIGKIYGFFNIIFNPKIYGMYVSIFILLINRKYLSCISDDSKFLKKIPWFILMSYFAFCLINNIFSNINILAFREYLDTMNFLHIPPTTTIWYETIKTFIIIIYYICLVTSIIYMTFKTIWKNNKFLFLCVGLTFISAMIPTLFIRFTGTRYYLYFFVALLLSSVNFILDSKKQSFNLSSVFLFGILIPFKYLNIAVIVIALVSLTINKLFKIINIYSLYIILCLIIIISIINFICTIMGYMRNSKIYKNNEMQLINGSYKTSIEIDEIPYRDSFYSWHSIVISCNNSNLYYGFYLNDFYSNYYGIDMTKVNIVKENGDYVVPYY